MFDHSDQDVLARASSASRGARSLGFSLFSSSGPRRCGICPGSDLRGPGSTSVGSSAGAAFGDRESGGGAGESRRPRPGPARDRGGRARCRRRPPEFDERHAFLVTRAFRRSPVSDRPEDIEKSDETTWAAKTYQPNVDIWETAEALVLAADVPGVTATTSSSSGRRQSRLIEVCRRSSSRRESRLGQASRGGFIRRPRSSPLEPVRPASPAVMNPVPPP